MQFEVTYLDRQKQKHTCLVDLLTPSDSKDFEIIIAQVTKRKIGKAFLRVINYVPKPVKLFAIIQAAVL